ncbi:hypothetical protein EC991_000216 [Linnemannia zychae]|nr:hypothetical protein EC991_000216 [Linnemannia zychae]
MAHPRTRRISDNSLISDSQDQDPEKEQQNSPAQELAERVYSWSITELDYRPDQGDIRARSHPRIALYASTSRNEQPEYCPQALISLCHGPCGSMFAYLTENLKSRSKIAGHNGDIAGQTLERKKRSLEARQKQQSRTLQCHELTLAIARKQREIAEAKERIRKQRQLQTVKEIHHQQEVQTIRILQEYQERLQQTQIAPLVQGAGVNRHIFEAALQKTLQDIYSLLKQVIIEQPHAARGSLEGRSSSVQSLYELLQRTNDGVNQLLEIIAGSKSAQLQALESFKDKKLAESQAGSVAIGNNEAARLLHMFRGHHVERVIEVESTLNKVAACEQEKAQLYSEMRFRAQRREQEKKPNHFLQEVEETKALLNGLKTALEFIQTEQENLVERVVATDELKTKIEVIGRASRAAEQRLRGAQHGVRKATEMVELNLQKVPSLATSIAGDITESLSQGLAQLSTSVQARNTTGVNDIKILQDLTTKSQVAYEASHAHLIPLPGPSWPDSSSLSLVLGVAGIGESSHAHAWYEASGSSSLSTDQLILQRVRLQSHNLIRQRAVSKAKDLNTHLARFNTEMGTSMKTTTFQLLSSSPLGTDAMDNQQGSSSAHQMQHVTGALSVDNLGSKFEGDIKDVVDSLNKYDAEYHKTLATEIEHIAEGAESANVVVESGGFGGVYPPSSTRKKNRSSIFIKYHFTECFHRSRLLCAAAEAEAAARDARLGDDPDEEKWFLLCKMPDFSSMNEELVEEVGETFAEGRAVLLRYRPNDAVVVVVVVVVAVVLADRTEREETGEMGNPE